MSAASTLHAYLSGHLAEMVDDLRRLVEIETPSGDAEGIVAAASVLAEQWQRLGCPTEAHHVPGVGVHLEVHVPGREASHGHGLVLGHLDTVYPRGTLAASSFRLEGDRAWGPGAYDMKAGLVMMGWAVRALAAARSAPRRPLTFLVTADEEVGSATARPLIERRAHGAAYALVLEPAGPGGAVKTARKGVAQYRLTVSGRSAHAGNDFWRGINANVALAEILLAVHALSDRESGTTVNVGVMGGGTRPNVVPEQAWADVDVRFASRAEAERIDRAMRELQAGGGARLEVAGGVNRWPLERRASAALYDKARALAAQMGLQLAEIQAGGASDGNITAELGVPTLDGLGPEGDGAHSADEYVHVPSLPLRTALLARILETF